MSILSILFGRVSGKTPIRRVNKKILLCGKEYSIRLCGGIRNSCKICDDVLVFTLKEMTRENFRRYYSHWYRRQARKLFQESMFRWHFRMRRLGYHLPDDISIKIYRMRRAWGRCYYTKGLITLNLHLASAPQVCIDYILLHELCHFLFHDHSRDFYGAVERLDGNWRNNERLLNDFARILF